MLRNTKMGVAQIFISSQQATGVVLEYIQHCWVVLRSIKQYKPQALYLYKLTTSTMCKLTAPTRFDLHMTDLHRSPVAIYFLVVTR